MGLFDACRFVLRGTGGFTGTGLMLLLLLMLGLPFITSGLLRAGTVGLGLVLAIPITGLVLFGTMGGVGRDDIARLGAFPVSLG